MNKRMIWISSTVGATVLVLGGAAIAFATPTATTSPARTDTRLRPAIPE